MESLDLDVVQDFGMELGDFFFVFEIVVVGQIGNIQS
jgi:hypothetical protein